MVYRKIIQWIDFWYMAVKLDFFLIWLQNLTLLISIVSIYFIYVLHIFNSCFSTLFQKKTSALFYFKSPCSNCWDFRPVYRMFQQQCFSTCSCFKIGITNFPNYSKTISQIEKKTLLFSCSTVGLFSLFLNWN